MGNNTQADPGGISGEKGEKMKDFIVLYYLARKKWKYSIYDTIAFCVKVYKRAREEKSL
jgi:hypothetical protein